MAFGNMLTNMRGLEGMTLSEVRQRQPGPVWLHLYVRSKRNKKPNQKTKTKTKNPTHQNKLWIERADGWWPEVGGRGRLKQEEAPASSSKTRKSWAVCGER